MPLSHILRLVRIQGLTLCYAQTRVCYKLLELGGGRSLHQQTVGRLKTNSILPCGCVTLHRSRDVTAVMK